MERHLDTLLARIRQANAGEIDEDEVYVWWGKVRSEHREGDLPHLERICALDSDVDEREVHVYLTDYRSLFVAHLGKVSCEDPRSDPGEPVPDYYANIGDCDCWFQLWDIRRIVSDDTSEVVSQLRKLRDPSYHNRPVSIYGGMRDLPLIVTREDDVEFFDPDRRQHLTDGKHWAEFDAEHSGIGSIERELRENMLGDRAWAGLNPAARTFAASAEKVMRDHRADFAFDFSPVVVELCKTYEVQSNELLTEARAADSAAEEVFQLRREEQGRYYPGTSHARRARASAKRSGVDGRVHALDECGRFQVVLRQPPGDSQGVGGHAQRRGSQHSRRPGRRAPDSRARPGSRLRG